MALRMSQLKGCSRSPLSTARRPPVREMRSLVLARVAGEYPDADLIAATREAFPEKVGIHRSSDNDVTTVGIPVSPPPQSGTIPLGNPVDPSTSCIKHFL